MSVENKNVVSKQLASHFADNYREFSIFNIFQTRHKYLSRCHIRQIFVDKLFLNIHRAIHNYELFGTFCVGLNVYYKFIRSAYLQTRSKRLNISDHNQQLFFLYSRFVNVYLDTRISYVGEVFTEL